jgi:hypothetical protein
VKPRRDISVIVHPHLPADLDRLCLSEDHCITVDGSDAEYSCAGGSGPPTRLPRLRPRKPRAGARGGEKLLHDLTQQRPWAQVGRQSTSFSGEHIAIRTASAEFRAASFFSTFPRCTSTVRKVLSVLCEPVSTWRSLAHELTSSAGERLPLRQCGGAAFLECGAVDEMAFLGKVVVERGVD